MEHPRVPGQLDVSDLFAEAEAYLAQQRDAWMSRAVTYARGALTVPVNVMASSPSHVVVDGEQASTRIEGRDYTMNYFGIEPLPGDTITDGGIVYEVANALDGEAHFRWCDASRTSIRIHTKRVSS